MPSQDAMIEAVIACTERARSLAEVSPHSAAVYAAVAQVHALTLIHIELVKLNNPMHTITVDLPL